MRHLRAAGEDLGLRGEHVRQPRTRRVEVHRRVRVTREHARDQVDRGGRAALLELHVPRTAAHLLAERALLLLGILAAAKW